MEGLDFSLGPPSLDYQRGPAHDAGCGELPPELADAAVAQWEQALRLAQQSARCKDNAARASSSCTVTPNFEVTRLSCGRRNGTWPRACGNGRSPMRGVTST